jgi:hypothetical protein
VYSLFVNKLNIFIRYVNKTFMFRDISSLVATDLLIKQCTLLKQPFKKHITYLQSLKFIAFITIRLKNP